MGTLLANAIASGVTSGAATVGAAVTPAPESLGVSAGPTNATIPTAIALGVSASPATVATSAVGAQAARPAVLPRLPNTGTGGYHAGHNQWGLLVAIGAVVLSLVGAGLWKQSVQSS
jgi:hypothetical protein